MSRWDSSRRRESLPPEWPQIRRQVFREKGRVCVCGNAASEVDHIKPGNDHSMANLRPICVPCHKRKSSGEGHAAKAALKKRFQRVESHPGLI